MRLLIHPEVSYIVRQILRMPPKTKMFCANIGDTKYILPFADNGILVTSIASDPKYLSSLYPVDEILGAMGTLDDQETDEYSTKAYVTDGKTKTYPNKNTHHFKPTKAFHYGFTFPEFEAEDQWLLSIDTANDIQTVVIPNPNYGAVKPIKQVADDMLHFTCSRSQTTNERIAPLHLVNLEQMHEACLEGGYFAAVLPKNWLGKNIRYGKWWNDTVATVARINLPAGCVLMESDTPVQDTGLLDKTQWQLYIFMKMSPRKDFKHRLLYAEFRYTTFSYTMDSINEVATAKLVKQFRTHDWWNKSVKLWNSMLESNPNDGTYGTNYNYNGPPELPDPRKTRIFKPNSRTRPGYKIAKDAHEIAADPFGVHIQPGPPIKLRAYNLVAIASLLDISAFEKDVLIPGKGTKEDTKVDEFTLSLRRKQFIVDKEWLVKKLQEKGLQPYLTATDHQKLAKQEKWLNIQLAPFERCVPNGQDELGITEWEWLYTDFGIKAMYPHIVAMWEKRAKKMRMEKTAFDFQFDDIVRGACKQSVAITNVMGLGKTLESLLLSLLRGCKHTLIIVPGRLVGVWEKELKTNVANFCRRNRKNWKGDLIYADYQVIEWAEQCRPENLKTFNIITFEKLTQIPKDALFFQCPKCQFVAASLKGVQQMPCPNPDCVNHKRRQIIKEYNRANGLKKFRSKGGQVHDTRLHPVALQMMDKMEYRSKKERKVLMGYDRVRKPLPNGDSTWVDVPRYEMKERVGHIKWRFAELIRKLCQTKISNVIIEEAVSIKNANAQRSKAVHHCPARHRTLLTGTPVKGYPQSLLNLLNYNVKRSVFPDYRLQDEGAVSRFMDKYATYTKIEGGPSKLIPKVNNPEQLQAEIAPIMIRHTRDEPCVVRNIEPRHSRIVPIRVDMDPLHRAFYQKWLDQFVTWFIEKKKEEGKKAIGGEIMVKLGYLANASTIPHAIFDNMMKNKNEDSEGAAWAAIIGPYKGPPTQKQLTTWKLIREAQAKGDKTLVFSGRRANLTLGQRWAERQVDPPVFSLIVDGTVNNTKKHQLVENFQEMDYNVMWAGLHCMSEGFNIPKANNAIFMDYDWEPSIHRQATGRMLRPQQTKDVTSYYLSHNGTVDDYMAAICILKGRSGDEAIDHIAFDDISESMIPDVKQYANSIVDGTQHIQRRKMWLAVEEVIKQADSEEEWGSDEDDEDE